MSKMKIKIWNIEEITGYKPITTFYQDFSIADKFGLDSIQETYDKVIKEELGYKELTEFTMALNWKIWEHYEEGKENETAKLYDKLWREAANNAMENLKGEELSYYFRTTD